jgi:hypothetical protein
MRKNFVRSAAVLAAALAVLPSALAAQSAGDEHGFFLGAGGGLGRTTDTGSHEAQVGFLASIRTGWRFNPNVALMLESSINTGNDRDVDSSSVIVLGPGGSQSELPSRRVKLGMQSLLVSLQLGNAKTLYVRPGIGVASHSYGYYAPHSNDVYIARTGHESGLAGGIAVGRMLPIPGFPLNVEVVGLYGHGEDSTSPRWSTGLQVVREIQF